METMMQSAVCLLEQAAEKFKNKTVFEDKDGSISFEELREKSRIIGSELIKRVETGRKCPVIVYLPKSIKSIISFMGSLYSASPYVPIDYAIPMARMEKTVENLHPTAIITDTDGKTKLESLNLDTEILIFDELADGQADDAAVDKSLGVVCDLDPAYIMYTSGSTGVPKGVTISNRGVIDYIEWIVETFPIDENSVIGMQSAFHFDNSVFDMYTAFYTGAKTMIIPEILFMYPEKLMDYMTENKISVMPKVNGERHHFSYHCAKNKAASGRQPWGVIFSGRRRRSGRPPRGRRRSQGR